MINLRAFGKGERGLSLVETLAAILVFSIVTIGIVPLLVSSIQGTALARSHTVGKEVARQAMERVRGLPFYISFDTISQKVDVLDMYLPCADPTMNASACGGGGTRGYDADDGTFTITCAPQTEDEACAVDIPAGYTLTLGTFFVEPDGTTPKLADADYGWNVAGEDTPETDLVHMTVEAEWTTNGRDQSFAMHSLVGDRKVGEVKVAGNGRVHYGVQVLTRYRKPAGLTSPAEISDLTAVLGSSESRIESRLVSGADQRFRTADIQLVAQTEPLATDLAELIGVVGTWRAPPTFAATGGVSSAEHETWMNHPSLVGQHVAYLHQTKIDSVEVRVGDEQPIAGGTFTLPSQPGNLGFARVQPQKPEGLIDLVTNPLRLDWGGLNPRGMVALAKVSDSGSERLEGSTEAVTGELGTASRRVETEAEVDVGETRLFPVEYIGSGASFRRSIVQIQNFRASVNCNATGTSATTEADWSARIRYWTHDEGFQTINVEGADGKIVFSEGDTVIATVDGGSDLQTGVGGNVLLRSGTLAPDLWLFDEPEENRMGYFTSFTFAAPATSTDGAKSASAEVNDAISITTVPPNPDFDESALIVSIGKLSCTALDNR